MAKKRRSAPKARDPVVLFHRTTSSGWKGIREGGFKNGRGYYGLEKQVSGVWLSDSPLDANEGAKGDVVLSVELDISRTRLRRYEVREDGKPYREYLMPAALLNTQKKPRLTRKDSSVWPVPDDPPG